jgi:hypothetical protein
MAKKRYTDAEKWKDDWFLNLTNDYKLIWIWLLDDCNHAGIWKKSMRRLNFDCNTDITESELLGVIGERITIIDTDKWFIKKFCEFQNGKDFLTKTSKPILSVIKLLEDNGIVYKDSVGNYSYNKNNSNSIDSVSIQYSNTILTPRDKDKGQEQDTVQDKVQEEVKVKGKLVEKVLDKLIDTSTDITSYNRAVEDFKDIGWDNIVEAMGFDEDTSKRWLNQINTIYNIKTNQL